MFKKAIIILIILAIILALYALGRQISSALQTGRRLDKAVDELSKLQEENRALQEKLAKVSSTEFLERQARDKLNLSKPDETIVIIDPVEINKVLGISKKKEEIKLPNWRGWLRLILN